MIAKDKSYKVLFIGNSYTFFHNMPVRFFEKLAVNSGYDIITESITCGGYRLCQHADSENEYGERVKNSLENNKYDFVILQGHSRDTYIDREAFLYSGKKIAQYVSKNGAKLCLYSTWGYGKDKASKPTLYDLAPTTADMEKYISEAYMCLAEDTHALCGYAGKAMTYALENTSLDIYDADNTHPSPIGSCMAAMTLFGTAFGVEVNDMSITDEAFGENEFAKMKKAVEYALTAGEKS